MVFTDKPVSQFSEKVIPDFQSYMCSAFAQMYKVTPMWKYPQGQDLRCLQVANKSCMLIVQLPSWVHVRAFDSAAREEECHFGRESVMNETDNEQESR